ncbi:hypothetical protein BT63DRAFT_14841 [Microthyrium microscopicum]|uniref:C2H2-type domain-containing protein n=1 Tax=Microthyrium microscopicum TaxID=703497 RepID=A0A6A6UQL9_9PEZI|nr:hypothetical protein BT63DRAFT_14841 [Microthyrium microscopicum]
MASYPPYNMIPQSQEDQLQNFLPSSGQDLQQNLPLMGHSPEDIANYNATNSQFGSYAYVATQSNPSQMPTSEADLYYQQQNMNTTTTSNYLQQPMDHNAISTSSANVMTYSPSTVHDHLSPQSFVGDSYSSDSHSHFETSNLDQAFADTSINSPLLMNHDANAAFYNVASASHPNSAMPSPHMAQHPSPHFGPQNSYQTDQRPSNLSLNVPNFGNNVYSTEDSHNITPPNGSSNDLSRSPMKSPIVRIENCDDDPDPIGLSRSLSRRSQASNNLLSPYADEEEYFDEEDWSGNTTIGATQTSDFSTTRNDDGSWRTERGTGGLSPIERSVINDAGEMPTLDEQEEQRNRDARNQHVEHWIFENEDYPAPRRSRQHQNRPRARSTNDITAYSGYLNVPQPGPGVLVSEASEFGEGEEEDGEEGSSNTEEDREPSSPPADVRNRSQASNGSPPRDPKVRPWVDIDLPTAPSGDSDRNQPYTANDAMMVYQSKAKEVDNASLAATIGSRRRSVTDLADLDSLWSQPGISREVTIDPNNQSKEKKGISGYFSNMLPGRVPSRSNSKKRKSDAGSSVTAPSAVKAETQNAGPSMPRRKSSLLGRPKTPMLDTNLSSTGTEGRSPIMATIQKFRHRSKSDIGNIGRSRSPGGHLADQWRKHGGPPVGTLASPAIPFGQSLLSPSPHPQDAGEDSDEDGEGETGVTMDLTVRLDMNVIPTFDGFQRQINSLNPHLEPKILDRLVQEQSKRYKRLVDSRIDHQRVTTMKGHCSSKGYCTAVGGQAQPLEPKLNGKSSDALPVVFQVVGPGQDLDSQELEGDNQAAQFPFGIPLPPVKTLPARFECPYCFKVKDFKKPSDWTKHIHEDVQPFTCTFPDCTDSKSFKRKADWVRHENERHRQLESWTCCYNDCSHVCYRRDNFVQHLVREHKIPEPKIRTGRNAGSRSPARGPAHAPIDFGTGVLHYPRSDEEVNDYVGRLVEDCRKDSDKTPSSEPCRFCGNTCTSFKKLTVHLAKHMEQIAMPIIPLVEQHPGARDTSSTTNARTATAYQMASMPTHPSMLPTTASAFMYSEEPGEMDVMPTISINAPPPQLTYPFPNATLLDVDAYSNQFQTGTSYPPAVMTPRSRGSSINEQQQYSLGQQHEATYPPANMPARQSGMGLGLQQSQYGQQQQQQGQYFGDMGGYSQ